MTKTIPRARYTLEFKQEAVRLVEGGHSESARWPEECYSNFARQDAQDVHRQSPLPYPHCGTGWRSIVDPPGPRYARPHREAKMCLAGDAMCLEVAIAMK